jgi:glycosyltransferase involved in cell wall biosynthesis
MLLFALLNKNSWTYVKMVIRPSFLSSERILNTMVTIPQPLVSVALITYNGEKYLRQQLDSIFSQTYKPLEVIASDDCSTDGTMLILDNYSQSRGLKVYRNKKNGGYVKNFERTVGLCSGHYIAPSDQDDIWLPYKIERLVEEIGSNSLVYSDAELIDFNGGKIAHSVASYSRLPQCSRNFFSKLLFNAAIIGCTALFKKELLKKVLPIPEGEKYHDWWLSIVAAIQQGIAYVPEPLMYYRLHGENALGLKKDGRFIDKAFGFIFARPNRDFFVHQVSRMTRFGELPIFNNDQKSMIENARLFYQDRISPGLHWKAFIIALKYQRDIFPHLSRLLRGKAVLGCLLR